MNFIMVGTRQQYATMALTEFNVGHLNEAKALIRLKSYKKIVKRASRSKNKIKRKLL